MNIDEIIAQLQEFRAAGKDRVFLRQHYTNALKPISRIDTDKDSDVIIA
jgi:hypothetical protein